MRIKCIVLACFVLVFAGAMSSQTQFSAKIPANTIHVPVTLANPVYYNETITAVGVSTPSGAMNCSGVYPQISFRYKRGGVDNALGYVVTSAGSSWTQAPVATPLQPGDQVTAFLNDDGVGCTNELPLTVYFVAQYTGGIWCGTVASACFTGGQPGLYRMIAAVGPHPAIILAAHRPSVPKAYQIPANIPVSPFTNP